jgi:hypothetical protein
MEAIGEIANKGGHVSTISLNHNYLRSPARVYFGIIQGDGRFTIFRGTGPTDKGKEIWSTGVSDPSVCQGAKTIDLTFMGNAAKGFPVYARVVASKNDPDGGPLRYYDQWTSPQFHIEKTDTFLASVDDDGRLCLHVQAEGQPASTRKQLWNANDGDPMVGFDLSKITYDLAAAKFLSKDPVTCVTLDAENPTDRPQTPTVTGTFSMSKTSGWSNALAVKVGIKVTAKVGVPVVADTSVEVSSEVQNTYTWNGATSETVTYSFSAPLSLGPGERGKVTITAVNTTISVPYSGTGEIVFRSGDRWSRTIDGVYEGRNGHSVKAVYSTEKMPPKTIPLTLTRV